jgi:hypothetical protein
MGLLASYLHKFGMGTKYRAMKVIRNLVSLKFRVKFKLNLITKEYLIIERIKTDMSSPFWQFW